MVKFSQQTNTHGCVIKAFIGFVLMVCSGHVAALSMTVILPEGQVWSSVYHAWAKDNVDQLAVQNLNRIDVLEARISDGLPADEVQAFEPAMAIAKANQDEAIAAWQQALLIKRFEIDQLPAIIINDRAVYYGLNPRLAIDAFERLNP